MAYTVPSAADLIAFYPVFADVAPGTIAAHISRAATTAVDTTWLEADYSGAIIDHAAHTMALAGLEPQDEVTRYARAGVTGIRSGSFSAQFSDARVSAASGGGFDATAYGKAYKAALRRSKGGARIVSAPLGDDGWGATAICNDGTRLPWGS